MIDMNNVYWRFKNLKGEVIGHGSEKFCYLNKKDKSKCFKVSKVSDDSQIRKEISYFKMLDKKGEYPSFLPKFYGGFESKEYIGYEQECFLETSKGGKCDKVCSLCALIENIDVDIKEITYQLDKLKCEMLKFNFICCDLHGKNILYVVEADVSKLVVIDGIGGTELFPVAQYVKILGRLKIERQWKKLNRRLKASYLVRESLNNKNRG